MTIAGLAWFVIVQFRGGGTERTTSPQPVLTNDGCSTYKG
jgi:hypothetical protein